MMLAVTPKLIGEVDSKMAWYAKRLLRDHSFPLDDEQLQREEMLAREIDGVPEKKKGRAFDHIKRCVKASRLERAAAEISGMKHNDGFDKRDPNSYNHDIYDDHVKIEVKRFQSRFWSYDFDHERFDPDGKPIDAVRTLRNNKHRIDYVLAGRYEERDGVCYCSFKLLLKAATFDLFEFPSDFNDKRVSEGLLRQNYYRHMMAACSNSMSDYDEGLLKRGLPPLYNGMGHQAIFREDI